MKLHLSNKFLIIIILAVIVIALLLIITNGVSDSQMNNSNTLPIENPSLNENQYNAKLNELMSDIYPEYTILDCCDLGDEDLYIVNSEGAVCIVGFIYQYGEDGAFLGEYLRDFEYEKEYYIHLKGIDDSAKIIVTSKQSNQYHNALLNQRVSIGENKYYLSIDELSATEKEYVRFQNFVDWNIYDRWLELKISEGVDSITWIYGEYLKNWYAEFEFTLDYAKDLFENEEEYLIWKSKNEEWLKITRELLNKEVNQFTDEMHRLEVIIPYSDLVRQKVIDTKYFLYILENNTTEKITDYISLKWKGWK